MIFVLAGIATFLTIAMFRSRNLLLGFPCLMFWAVFGGHCYTESIATWDIHYLTFFASMGMAIFCAIAMYALRPRDIDPRKQDWDDSDELIGEGKPPRRTYDDRIEEPAGENAHDEADDNLEKKPKPSSRVKEIRDRASRRRSGRIKKKTDWGEFS